jgi:hypothetical protein
MKAATRASAVFFTGGSINGYSAQEKYGIGKSLHI